LVRRGAQGLALVVIVATITFALLHLAPGDPFTAAADNPNISEALRAQWRRQAGLDRPLVEQYGRYLLNLASGHLGPSYAYHRPVADVLAEAIPNTLVLMGTALVASFVIGVALGIVQALRRGGFADRMLGAVSIILGSLPDFWLAIVMMLALAYWL